MKDVAKIKNNIVELLKENYSSFENIKLENLLLLNEGEYFNATVFRYKGENLDLTIKDFTGSPWIVRNTMGKVFIRREGRFLERLKDNEAVTKNARCLSVHTLVFDFVKGKPLKGVDNKSIEKERFLELESNIKKMHEAGIVHLDLRNFGNIIEGEDEKLYIIDFQSSVSLKRVPKKIGDIAKNSDLSGVYKCWINKCKEELDPERKEFLEKFGEMRKFWVLKGYPLKRLRNKIKGKFSNKK